MPGRSNTDDDERPDGSPADRPQDPLVGRLRPDPSQAPQAVLVREGLLGDSDRAGFRRVYFTRELDRYAEFRAEDALAVEAIPADQPPFPRRRGHACHAAARRGDRLQAHGACAAGARVRPRSVTCATCGTLCGTGHTCATRCLTCARTCDPAGSRALWWGRAGRGTRAAPTVTPAIVARLVA
jgi:hypothetical protein